MKIALFGTSGDPPTKGHQMILRWLSDRFDLCAVWVSNNPFKSHQASLEQRLAMMQLLIADINAPKIQLHPEISSPRSLITVNEAKRIWTDAEFTLIIGADLVTQLRTWYQAEELLQQVKILVISRAGYDLSEQSLEPLYAWGARIAIADLVVPEVSSSAYRQNADHSGIIPAVAEYINLHNLYTCQDSDTH
jgi:nicotinate-nucleotide adenylyltransferase